LLVVVGVVLWNGLLKLPPVVKVKPVDGAGVAAGVVEAAEAGVPNVKGADEVTGVVDPPKANPGVLGVSAGVVDGGAPNEKALGAGVDVVLGVVGAPNPNGGFVGVLTSNGSPRFGGLTGLGDSEPKENGLDCGVVLIFSGAATGVVKENGGLVGDGVAGVVLGTPAVAVELVAGVAGGGAPNEKGEITGLLPPSTVALASFGAWVVGVVLVGRGPKLKGLGGSFETPLTRAGGLGASALCVEVGGAPKEKGAIFGGSVTVILGAGVGALGSAPNENRGVDTAGFSGGVGGFAATVVG
jgi:hypothetical protein